MNAKLSTKHSFRARLCLAACGLALLLAAPRLTAQTINVGNSGTTAYVIGGTNNPTLRLERGVTYVFQVNASGHPFYIKTVDNSTGTGNQYTTGVTGNGAQTSQLVFAVPLNAPNSLYYHCSVHSAMGGSLVITNPIAPPTVKVVYLNVDSFITVKSTGTNGWGVVPEYLCNLGSTNWNPVSAFTNAFAGGTNTTTFSRLDAFCGFSNVLLRIRNQKN